MNIRFFWAISSMLALMVLGCSNVKDANESNFKKAAQDYLDNKYPYCYIAANFPHVPDRRFIETGSATKEMLEKMAALGLVQQTEITRKKRQDSIFPSTSSEEETERVLAYELTEEGKKHYKKADAASSLLSVPLGGFCFGKAQVAKIENFTEPSDFMGLKVSKVTYTYTVTDIPEWAKEEALLNLDKRLKEDVLSEKAPVKKSDGFALTEKGWIHEKLLK